MPLVGITGGPATGKSTALTMLSALGAFVVDSDDIVHALYRDDEELAHRLEERWGPDAFRSNGEIDRQWIARTVFQSDREREWLNSVVHPRVRDRLLRHADRCCPHEVYCAVPLLFEVGWHLLMNTTCAVWCPEALQKRRLNRRGWDSQRVDRCMASQLPADKKLEMADFGLLNLGQPKMLREQCGRLIALVRKDMANGAQSTVPPVK